MTYLLAQRRAVSSPRPAFPAPQGIWWMNGHGQGAVDARDVSSCTPPCTPFERLCFALSECSIIIFTCGGWRPPPVDWVHPIDGPASLCRHRRRRRHLPSPPLGRHRHFHLSPHHLPPLHRPATSPPTTVAAVAALLPPPPRPTPPLPPPLAASVTAACRSSHRMPSSPPSPPTPPPSPIPTSTVSTPPPPSPSRRRRPPATAAAGSGRLACPPFRCRRHCRSVPRLIYICSCVRPCFSLRLRVVCDLSMLLYISFCVYGAGSCSIVSSAVQSIIIFTLGAR